MELNLKLIIMVVLITGASKGIGKFLSDYFAAKGFQVFGTQLKTQLSIVPGIKINQVDVSIFSQVETWIKSLPLVNEKLILINAAGISYNAFAHKADPEKWLDVIKVNLFGSFNTSKCVLPLMREVNYGRIINISSVVPQLGIHGTSAYSASKSGLWGLTKTLSIENATKGITVNNLNLGYFDIGMIKDVPEDMQKVLIQKIPQQTFGNPRNIINAVEFLIESDYTTGTSVNINGGLY